MKKPYRLVGSVACAALLALGAGLPAGAQIPDEALVAQIREVSFDSSGQTRLIVSVSGAAVTGATLGVPNFSVVENGRQVDGLAVEELFDSGARQVAVVVMMDVSGSTRDGALDAAKVAAADFVRSLPDAVRIAVMSFSTTSQVVSDFATDKQQALDAIAGLEAGGGTAFYDAMIAAADLLSRQFAQRTQVIFTDGAEGPDYLDNQSDASLEEALAALENAEAATTVALLAPPQADTSAHEALADGVGGGTFLRVEDGAQLTAAFARFAQAISSQYVITYPADDRATPELALGVTVAVGAVTATDSSVVLNRRGETGPLGPQPVEPPKPLVGFFASDLGLYLGIAAAFVGVALFLIILLQAPAGRTEEKKLARRLRMYSRTERVKEREEREREGAFGGSALGRRAVEFVEGLPWTAKFGEKVQKDLDRAAWSLRASEFILINAGAILGGFLVGLLLFQRVYWAVLLAVVGAFIPRLVLAQRVAKRTAAFLGQLPDTLQLLSGSLQAGYGFMQALDTVSKEAGPPAGPEFARVLAEARLGMPVEQALEDMAGRVGGEDFRWVVMAINIQRQVGGNLAQLLNTVAETLRERERVRRQIKVLSAEGKLSAYILIALPFGLFGYLMLVNPEYIGELTGSTFGRVLIVAALILMGVGAVWMRKIIKIDV